MKKEAVTLFLILCIAFPVFLLSISPVYGNGVNSGTYKHLIAYFVLSMMLGVFAQLRHWPAPLLSAAVVSGTYGALIEVVQRFLSYRNGNLFDALLDYAAALFAALCVVLLRSVARMLSRLRDHIS